MDQPQELLHGTDHPGLLQLLISDQIAEHSEIDFRTLQQLTSEHQLGLAVDINGAVYDIYLWLEENSWKYGFIFRYPAYKTDLTGVAGEVWHYRYVGKEAAQEIYEQGVCLEEYLETLQEDGVSWDESD